MLVLDRGREKADESAGEVAKGSEEPELEPAPEEVEAVGEVEGEGVRVLAPCELAAGGRERGKEAETEAVDTMSEGKTCDPDFILLLVLPLLI